MNHIPEWLFEFHGHQCPFVVIGYRMGLLAMERLEVKRARNYEMYVFSELGIGHPQGCLQDGIQASTSATFGKGQMHRLNFGKVAVVFYYSGKIPLRITLKNEFNETLSSHEFFKYRQQGIEPSEIPQNITDDIIDIVKNASNQELFLVKDLPLFKYQPVESSFNKAQCEICGEHVFERYLRRKNGKLVCIPCSEYLNSEKTIYLPLK